MKMGFDLERFKGTVPDVLVCAVCSKVAENPLKCKDDHIFCSVCITNWRKKDNWCPVERKLFLFAPDAITPVCRNVQAIVDNLMISCDYRSNGCLDYVRLIDLKSHVAKCEKKRADVAIQVGIPGREELLETAVKTLKRKLRIERMALEDNNSDETSKVAKLKSELNSRDSEINALVEEKIILRERIGRLQLRAAEDAKLINMKSVNERLKKEGFISYYVFRLMENIHLPLFHHFATTGEHYEEAKYIGRILRNGLNKLKKSKKILLLLDCPYVSVCLATYDGHERHVVTVLGNAKKQLMDSGYNRMVENGQLILENCDITHLEEHGCAREGPYDIVFTRKPKISDLVEAQLLSPSCQVVNILTGKFLDLAYDVSRSEIKAKHERPVALQRVIENDLIKKEEAAIIVSD